MPNAAAEVRPPARGCNGAATAQRERESKSRGEQGASPCGTSLFRALDLHDLRVHVIVSHFMALQDTLRLGDAILLSKTRSELQV